MTLADDLLGKRIPKLTGTTGRRVLMGTHRKPAKAPKAPHRQTAQVVMAVMADGRARSLSQIVSDARVNQITACSFLKSMKERGDVEVTIVARHWLYSITHQRGSHAAR